KQRFGFKERWGDTEVQRTPILISHSRNPIGRILNYLSFGFSSLSASRFLRDADVIYVYATQMTAAIAPLIWWKYLKIPFVLHVQDLWPESVTDSGLIGGPPARLIGTVLRPWLRACYRSSSATIGISPTMTKTLIDRGVDPKCAHTV